MSIAAIAANALFGSVVPTRAQNSSQPAQDFQVLGEDLRSGNLSKAQSDFLSLEQALQQQGGSSAHRHHRLHPGISQSFGQTGVQGGPATLFGELGTALKSGNLAAAQQTYVSLQQDFLQFASTAPGAGNGASDGVSCSGGLSVSA